VAGTIVDKFYLARNLVIMLEEMEDDQLVILNNRERIGDILRFLEATGKSGGCTFTDYEDTILLAIELVNTDSIGEFYSKPECAGPTTRRSPRKH
jgi:hypothetical protein